MIFFRHYEPVIKIMTTALIQARARKTSPSWHPQYGLIVQYDTTRLGMFTIYTNHSGINLLHKHKTIKFDVVGEQPATKYIQIS